MTGLRIKKNGGHGFPGVIWLEDDRTALRPGDAVPAHATASDVARLQEYGYVEDDAPAPAPGEEDSQPVQQYDSRIETEIAKLPTAEIRKQLRDYGVDAPREAKKAELVTMLAKAAGYEIEKAADTLRDETGAEVPVPPAEP